MFKNLPFLLAILLLSIGAQAQLQWGWAKSIGGTNDDYSKKVVTDSKNGIYTFGQFKSISFMVGSTQITNTGGSDLLLIKYDTAGNVLWAKSFGSTGDDSAYSITTDRSSNILIAGSFKNTINFGSTTLTSSGGSDAFFVKLNASGAIIWAKQTTGSLEDKAEVIKCDRYNNIYLTGRYKSNDFTLGGQVFTAPGITNQFYCKLDSNGNYLWCKNNISNSAGYYIYDIEFVNSANTTVLLAGTVVNINTTYGIVSFDTNILFTMTFSLPGLFMVQIDSSGKFNNQNPYGTRDRSGGIDISKNSKITYCGYHESSTNLFNANAFIHGELGQNQAYSQSNSIGNSVLANDILITKNYRLFSVGNFSQSSVGSFIDFYNGFTIPSAPVERSGIFIWESDTLGLTKGLLYADIASNIYLDRTLVSITIDTITNVIYAAGYFTAVVNSNFIIGNNTLISGGLNDGFIVKIKPSPSLPPALAITAGPDTTICLGNTITIGTASGATGGTAPYTYSWSPTTGLATPTSSTTSATPISTTAYILTVTDASFNTAKDTIVVSVNSGPLPATPSITPTGPTSFCLGDSVTLTSSSLGAVGYLWNTGATTQSIKIKVSGNYFVKTIGASGCYSNNSLATVVSVNVPPTPSITPSGNTTFCQGGNVTLTSNLTSGIVWSTGATTQSITVNTTGNYFVTYTNSFGCSATSTIVPVTVTPSPAIPLITAAGPATFCQGGNVTLTSNIATGNVWSNGATTQSITINTSGNFSVINTNTGGCSSTASAPVIVTVHPLPAIPVITQNGNILTSSSAVGNQWYLNNIAIAGATASTYTYSTSGQYTVSVTNATGCTSFSQPISGVNLIGRTLKNGDLFYYNVYPNPAKEKANLKYVIQSPSSVAISLVNNSGNLVSVLLQEQLQAAGAYSINFSATAAKLNNGVYFIVYIINGEKITAKLIINK
jgi:Secretion system C-terminal sorting domain